MGMKRTLHSASVLLALAALPGCRGRQETPKTPPAAVAKAPRSEPPPLTYHCDDGRTVSARYAGAVARLQVDGRDVEMTTARSASGARYIGGAMQWWTKGMEEARLSRLGPGEEIASDPGVACHVPAVAPPAPGTPGGLPDDRTPVAERPAPATSAQGAAQVVQSYYAAIEAGDYPSAWRLWGDGGRASGQATAREFARSFESYAGYHAQIGAPGRIEGAAGSLYVSVPVVIYGRLKSGAEVHESGSVDLRRVDDVPGSTPEQRRWHINRIETRPPG